jgi:hypothetical protein
MRWVGHVACIEGKKSAHRENLRERNHLEDLGVDGEDNIKKLDRQKWTAFFWFRIGTCWLALVKAVMNINTLNAELNPICHLLALLGAHHILHISGLRVRFP